MPAQWSHLCRDLSGKADAAATLWHRRVLLWPTDRSYIPSPKGHLLTFFAAIQTQLGLIGVLAPSCGTAQGCLFK